MRRPRARLRVGFLRAPRTLSCLAPSDRRLWTAFALFANRKNPQNSPNSPRTTSLILQGFRELYLQVIHRKMMHSFAARAARAATSKARAPGLQCRCGPVRRPKVLREMAFRAARRRRDVARGRRDGAAAGGCDSRSVVRRGATVGFPRRCSAPRAASASRSLLLKADPLVSGLSLYDVVNTPGVAADLSHCNTPATVTGVTGVGNAEEALKGADVVVIPAGS